MKTCPDPAIKNRLWHHKGKYCWHSYHMACVDAASEGMSSPTWLIIWQDPSCRRVPSTLIKSSAKHLSNILNASSSSGSRSQSEWWATHRQTWHAKKIMCIKCHNSELRRRQPCRLLLYIKVVTEVDYLYSTILQTIIFPCTIQHQVQCVL